jgi:hypothetical protein
LYKILYEIQVGINTYDTRLLRAEIWAGFEKGAGKCFAETRLKQISILTDPQDGHFGGIP